MLDRLLHDPNIFALQIYSFVFGALPFMCLDVEGQVASMIGFVEELPKEWEQKWELMQAHSDHARSLLTSKLPPNRVLFFLKDFAYYCSNYIQELGRVAQWLLKKLIRYNRRRHLHCLDFTFGTKSILEISHGFVKEKRDASIEAVGTQSKHPD